MGTEAPYFAELRYGRLPLIYIFLDEGSYPSLFTLKMPPNHVLTTLGTMGPTYRSAISNAFWLVFTLWLVAASNALAEPQPPEFATLENLVQQYFYHPDRREKPLLLTQSQVHGLLEELRRMHIYIPRRQQIVRSFPHDQEFFTRFVLHELAREPALVFPPDPTPLFQRIDALCASHASIREFLRIASHGDAFSESWGSRASLFPPLDEQVRLELETAVALRETENGPLRRRNYTIEHLTEAIREVYWQGPESPPTQAHLMRSADRIRTGSSGKFTKPSLDLTRTREMASTTSIPSTTSPKTQ